MTGLGLKMAAAAAKAKAKEQEVEAEEEEDSKSEGEVVAQSKIFGVPRKVAIIGAAALVVLIAGGAAGFFFLRSHGEMKTTAVPGKPVVFVDLPELLVNLSNTGSDRTQYLKVKIVLELPDQLMITQIQPVMPRVMDAFQTYLRELRPSDLDGSAGLYRLKEELTRRVNASIAPNRINAVLFKEIVVQ
jgi:flagellar protein FliL